MSIFESKPQMTITDSILPLAARSEIIANRLPQLVTDRIFLKKDEVCSYIDKAILNIHVKRKITQRITHSSKGLFKGTRIGTGISKPIEYDELNQQRGILYITNKRVIFQAPQNAFDKQHKYLSSIEPYNNAVILQYGEKTFELIVSDGSIVNNVLKMVNS